MIGRLEKIMSLSILGIIIVLLLMVLQSTVADVEQRTYNVSALAGDTSEAFRRGMEKAAKDFNVDLHMVSGYAPEEGRQQAEYLAREVDNGADALILRARDAEYMKEWLDKNRLEPAVVTVGEQLHANRGNTQFVGASDGLLGEMLADVIEESEYRERPCLVLLPVRLEAHVLGRYRALLSKMDDLMISYKILRLTGDGENEIMERLKDDGPAMLVTLDEATTLIACEQGRLLDVIFGIGFDSSLRTNLETGRIASLVVFSEFDAGYLSVREAVLSADGRTGVDNIELTPLVVNGECMYEYPYELTLFPIS